jgi:hypothetical protein
VGIINVTFRVGLDLAVTAMGSLVRLKHKTTRSAERLSPLTRIVPEDSIIQRAKAFRRQTF